jgi:hypothetical protein
MNLTNLGAASSCAAGATIYFSPIGGSFPLTKLPGFTGSPTNGNGDTISGNVWLRDLWTNTPGSLNVTITAQIDAV